MCIAVFYLTIKPNAKTYTNQPSFFAKMSIELPVFRRGPPKKSKNVPSFFGGQPGPTKCNEEDIPPALRIHVSDDENYLEGSHRLAPADHDKAGSHNKAAMMIFMMEILIIFGFTLFAEYDTLQVAPQATTPATVNGLQNYYPMFQDVHVMIFVGFGFLMTFMKRYSFSAVGWDGNGLAYPHRTGFRPVSDRFIQTNAACRICGVHVTVSHVGFAESMPPCHHVRCTVMSDAQKCRMSDLRSVISDAQS